MFFAFLGFQLIWLFLAPIFHFFYFLSLHFRTKTKLKWKPPIGDHGHHVSFLLYKWYDLTMFKDTIPSYHLTMYYTHIPLNSNRFEMGVLVHSLKKGLPRPTSKQPLLELASQDDERLHIKRAPRAGSGCTSWHIHSNRCFCSDITWGSHQMMCNYKGESSKN